MTEFKATNITRHEGHVSRDERHAMLRQKGCTLWLTGLSGCGKGGSGKKLHFYNWDTYIGKTTLKDFEAASGIDVDMSLLATNDELFAKLRGGNQGYDVIVPTNDFVQRISAAGYQLSRDDAGRLQSSLSGGSRRGGAASPLVARGVAVAALSVLGEDGKARSLMTEPKAAMCLRLAKLNLYQCLASSGPHYEDIFCLGQHAMIETGQCVVDATKAPTQRVAVTKASYPR